MHTGATVSPRQWATPFNIEWAERVRWLVGELLNIDFITNAQR
jgi:hypothetical protein